MGQLHQKLGHQARVSAAAPAVLALIAGVAAVSAFAQAYPGKAIRVVTSPAGGGNDVPARILSQGIAGPLGQQVIVDNRPTTIIADLVAKAPADGYTLLFSGSPHWIAPLMEA